jgi:hypothetical protein
MKIRAHVVQISEIDCGLAAVAIATGVKYEIVRSEALISQTYHHKYGVKPYQLKELLNRVTRSHWRLKNFAIFNMPKFIDLAVKEEKCAIYMICTRLLMRPGHCVVYQNGTVYDPSEPDPISIFQYKRAENRTIGVLRVDERST